MDTLKISRMKRTSGAKKHADAELTNEKLYSAKLMTQNEFEDAYDLLVIRSLTDESLADKVDYWTEMREELLYDEMDIAA